MRITYIIESLSNSGGMERVISLKASWLAEKKENLITIITFSQDSEPDFFPLNDNVNRVKWELKYSNSIQGDLVRHLKEWFNNNPQDICISTYGREFKILPKIKDGSKKIVEFHFAYDINKHWMANSCSQWKASVLGGFKTWIMVRIAKQYDRIVCLTNDDYKRWHTKKAIKINNPITINNENVSTCSSKLIVAIGRMDKQKGFDMLLNCWNLIENKYPDWHLNIYGGGDSSIYVNQIAELNLKHVSFLGRTEDIVSALCQSSIYVLSSRYEGFSLTICEAMSCGLPIVTFDCPSGPAELVSDGVNGYVVEEVGDIQTMAKRISDLIENEQRRKEFGKESHLLSTKYHMEYIMCQWETLFKELSIANGLCGCI